MKFSDIVALQDYFAPVCDVLNEHESYWKQFVTNQPFIKLLKCTLDALSDDEAQPGSLWVEGTFGSGKSHAAFVIKHLFSDPVESISDYVNRELRDEPDTKHRLLQLRNNNSYLPVILKGSRNISTARSFVLELQKEIKETLDKLNIPLFTDTQFEEAINFLDETGFVWSELIENSPEISCLVNDKDDIRTLLSQKNTNFLDKLIRALSSKKIIIDGLSVDNFTKWLREAEMEISKANYAGFIIIWDEFTPVLDNANSELLDCIQTLAEYTVDHQTLLYLISHRTHGASLDKAEITKTRDRFHHISYDMTPITTYQILTSTIKIHDHQETVFENYLRDTLIQHPELNHLIEKITHSQNHNLERLFPLHPYTAFLCSSISRMIGSSSRSVFKFFYDEQAGYLNYLKSDFSCNNFCTADIIWDFFFEDIQKDHENYGSIVNHYASYKDKIEKQGSNYLKVYKSILLLNVLSKNQRLEESSLSRPCKAVILDMYSATALGEHIDQIITTLSETILPDVDGNFIVGSAVYSQGSLQQRARKIKDNDDLEKQVKSSLDQLKISDKIAREIAKTHVLFVNNERERSKAERVLTKELMINDNHAFILALFFAKNSQDVQRASELIFEYKKKIIVPKDSLLIPIICEEPLGDKLHEQYVRYRASAEEARVHNHIKEADGHDNAAKQIIINWMRLINSKNCRVLYGTQEESIPTLHVGEHISNIIAPNIFTMGLDSIHNTHIYLQLWKVKKAEKLIASILASSNSEEFNNLITKGAQSKLCLAFRTKSNDSIVQHNLNLRDDCPTTHPIRLTVNAINEKMAPLIKKSKTFRLDKEFIFLSKPPFGYYQSEYSLAVLAYCLRPYMGKLYFEETGELIKDSSKFAKTIISMSEAWSRDKVTKASNSSDLKVRFGSQSEDMACADLRIIFDIDADDNHSIKQKIRFETFNKIGAPYWIISDGVENEKVKLAFNEMCHFLENSSEVRPSSEWVKLRKSLNQYKSDFSTILSNFDTESAFLKFIQSTPHGSDVDEAKLPAILEHFRSNLSKDIGSWTPDQTKEALMHFLLNEMKSRSPKHASYPSGESDTTQQDFCCDVDEKSTDGDLDWRAIQVLDRDELHAFLQHLIQKNPTSLSIIKAYFKI